MYSGRRDRSGEGAKTWRKRGEKHIERRKGERERAREKKEGDRE